MTQRDVSLSVLSSLASSVLVAPVFYLNPQNNVNYNVAAQVPIDRITSLENIQFLPLTPPTAGALLQPDTADPPSEIVQVPSPTVADVALVRHRVSPENINHYAVQRIVGVDLSVDGRDLGSVTGDIRTRTNQLGNLPKGMRIMLRGQNAVMEQSFRSLGLGLILAIMLVYSLMVVLFQSWLVPFIIIMPVPGALVGITWTLLLTGTTIRMLSRSWGQSWRWQ